MEIKGIKDGILINLEEQDWLDAKQTLLEQIESRQAFFRGARITLDVGNNVLRAKELGELREVLSDQGVSLWAVLSRSIVTRETAQILGLATQISRPNPKRTIRPMDTVLAGDPAVMVQRTLRSGFKIANQGHVVIIGDVNPGAEVIASGSVVIWGRLRGMVHAGADGNENAVICALDLSPMQLRIAALVATTPKQRGKPRPEMASIKDEIIIAEPWQHKGVL
jgi:septum site-determining protein MinC